MEYLPDFTTHRPATVAEAVKIYAGHGAARYFAGGTDMIVNVRRGIEQPQHLIDLSAIAELGAIRADADGLVIGSGVSLAEIAGHERVRRDFAAVAEAAGEVAGPTHRQYGTIGGNLCLDTRCIFYNQSEWWRKSNAYCLKSRGEVCHVAPGGKRCFAAYSGDTAPALLVYRAEVELIGPGGRRRIPLAELYRNDGMDQLAIEAGELLTAVHLPGTEAGAAAGYAKSRVRGSIDFPLAGCALWLKQEGGRVAELRVALTGVSPIPYLVKGTGAFHGAPLDEAARQALAELVQHAAKPMATTTVKPWYRRRVSGALAKRLARRLAGHRT
jgi:4-hydroxybenzoyl-CoA reductase subunit beta